MKKPLNREFRKVPSLQFLYEVNGDGTILRNVKSKKHIKIKLDMHHSTVGYYFAWVNIKHKVIRVPIHRIVAECWLGEKPRGYEIDHICKNRACCNLEHLQMLEGSEHAKKDNHLRNKKRKDKAKEYWVKNHCTGTALATLFGVSFSTTCRWIREWKA